MELRPLLSAEELLDEISPHKLVTALATNLLLVEGDEDDGVLEAAVRLSESPGHLQHHGQPGPVVVVSVRESRGIPVRPHYDDLVLCRVERLTREDADDVAALGDLLILLPELRIIVTFSL